MSRIATITRGNGTVTTNTYTPQNQLATQTTTNAGGQVLEAHSYTYDDHYNPATRTDTYAPGGSASATGGTWSTVYSYDAYDRLTGSAVYTGPLTNGQPSGLPVDDHRLHRRPRRRRRGHDQDHPALRDPSDHDDDHEHEHDRRLRPADRPEDRIHHGEPDLRRRGPGAHLVERRHHDLHDRRVAGEHDAARRHRDDLHAVARRHAAQRDDHPSRRYDVDGHLPLRRRRRRRQRQHQRHQHPGGPSDDRVVPAHRRTRGADPARRDRHLREGHRNTRRRRSTPAPGSATTCGTGTPRSPDWSTTRPRSPPPTPTATTGHRPAPTGGPSTWAWPTADGPTRTRTSVPRRAARSTDVGTGLLAFADRTYDPRQGRFTSPDPVDAHNRYQGFNTNPITYLDLSGQMSTIDIVLEALFAVVFVVTAVLTAGAAAAAVGAIGAAVEAGTEVTATVVVNAVANVVGTRRQRHRRRDRRRADRQRRPPRRPAAQPFLSKDQRDTVNLVNGVARPSPASRESSPASATRR